MTAAQRNAFQASGGISPDDLQTLLLSMVFSVLLLWGTWALRTAYSGWAEQRINQRQFLGVAVRVIALYVLLSFLLLS
ncbi:TIGR03758 family integrating conjugative element protein [Pseudomonas huaxiensis]|uniref:TIGR03758 family integrating conjugative element protein n=1 Tax=Pseudomonas huaxiensis TaxID=2213017 RepID=UPI000DA67F15|nr:TIGR03758 family integrating conjugative element protein [Pseudomonas huaxiensis]